MSVSEVKREKRLLLVDDDDSSRSPVQIQDRERTLNKHKPRRNDGRPLTGPSCAVCEEEAPDGQQFRKHYGVICCEACKCFFRRTVQMGKRYECKLSRDCPVGKNVRHWCQSCRFQKCCNSGMKREAVKGLGVNKKSGAKETTKRSKVDGPTHIRHKITKYDDSCDDAGEDYLMLSAPMTSPDYIGFVDKKKNGQHMESLGLGLSPVNLNNSLVNLSSPPSVSTLNNRLSETKQEEGLEQTQTLAGTKFASLSSDVIGHSSGYYGNAHYSRGGSGYSQHYTSPPTPVGATPSYPASYQSTPCPSACPSPYHPSACQSASNTPYATPYQTPVASPVSTRNTPAATPLQSPAPSPHPPFVNPCHLPMYYQQHDGVVSDTNSPLSLRSYPASCPVSPATSPTPLSSRSFQQLLNPHTVASSSQVSNIVSFPTISGDQVAFQTQRQFRAANKVPLQLPSAPPYPGTSEVHLTADSVLQGAPIHAISSTLPHETKALVIEGGALEVQSSQHQEAEVEEVLDSLRLRISAMFKWAKGEVKGFDDLSPLDQKALLRRTVAELVMLGFAKASIGFNDMLLLGKTGKIIQPTHTNSGIASVARITLLRLVDPLKILNIDNKELLLLKEVVLFNPEIDGLRNRDTVRQLRKRRLVELKEYTNNADPNRLGELLCLLTPLYEVGQEVTEQLRLEQFVNEGEARIDALLLMSMINDGGNIDLSLERIK